MSVLLVLLSYSLSFSFLRHQVFTGLIFIFHIIAGGLIALLSLGETMKVDKSLKFMGFMVRFLSLLRFREVKPSTYMYTFMYMYSICQHS